MRVVVHDYVGYSFTAQLARALAARGHDVLHLHCASFVAGKGRLARAEGDAPGLEFDAVSTGEPFAKYALRRRVAHERETGRALARRIGVFAPDVVLSGDAPLIVQRAVLDAAHKHEARFVFWQQDVISAAARRVVGRRSRAAGFVAEKMAASLERSLLRESEGVVVISDDFVPLLRRWGIDERRISVIENWAPLQELPTLPRDNGWAREHGLVGRTVLLYSGTLGFKHDPSLLLELARWAAGRDAVVVVVSAGPGAEWLAERGAAEPALLLLPYQPYERLPEVLASADLLLAVLEPDASAFSVPSKVLTYLCAGRPILASVPARNLAAQVVERSGGGRVVPPGDADALIAAAKQLLDQPDLRAELGRRARDYAEAAFDPEQIASRFESVLKER